VCKRNQRGKEKVAERDRQRGILSLKIMAMGDNDRLLEEAARGPGNI